MRTTILKLAAVAAWLIPTAAGRAADAPAAVASAGEWPRWQGPRGDGIARDATIAEKWPEAGPKRVWEKKVGIGFASPIGFEGKVYAFASDNPNKETLTAFDAGTGAVAWSQSYDIGKPPDYPGPRATPTIDAGKIYTYGSTGLLVGRNLADGKELWRFDVLKELGEEALGDQGQTWGQASSPLVLGDAVLVQAGRGGPIAVALDKASGKLLWKSEAAGRASYAAIIPADAGGKPQLIVYGGEAIFGVDPATGKTLWQQPWAGAYFINASTPIAHDGKLFVSNGSPAKGGRCGLFEMSPAGLKKVWEKKAAEGGIASRFQPVVLDDGYLYGIGETNARGDAALRCLDWSTGKMQWESKDPKLGFGGSLVRVGKDQILAMSQTGTLCLFQATPQKVQLLAQAEVFTADAEVWAMPLVYQGKVYAKGKDELVCLDVGK